MGIQFSDRVENIVGKEEIARHEQFLLFQQCFQNLSVVDMLKLVSMDFVVICPFTLGNKIPTSYIYKLESIDIAIVNYEAVRVVRYKNA